MGGKAGSPNITQDLRDLGSGSGFNDRFQPHAKKLWELIQTLGGYFCLMFIMLTCWVKKKEYKNHIVV